MLINVLFFEAAWLTSFDHAKTSDADFNSFHGRVACRMMSNPALNCRVGRTTDVAAVLKKMPFRLSSFFLH